MSYSDFDRSLGGHHGLRKDMHWSQRWHIDIPLLCFLVVLSVYSLFVLYSAGGSYYLNRQLIWVGISFAAMFIVAQFKVRFYRVTVAPAAYVGAVFLLALVLLVGVKVMGAQRWLNVGIRFQPSEFMKFILPMAVAAFIATKPAPLRLMHILSALALVFIPVLLILKQPDLGTSLLVAASGLIVIFMAGFQWRYLVIALGLAATALWPAWHYVLHPYQKQRILTLFNPDADRLGAGWNIIQSKTAIGSGGFYGKGWREGTQSQLDFLPESHTDFIIAVLGEEFGFVGVAVLLLLYALIIARGFWIAYRAQKAFSRLLAGALTFTFMVSIFVNVGMVTGLLPVVGAPLPLVSNGGTSFLSFMVGFGMLMAISTLPRRMSA